MRSWPLRARALRNSPTASPETGICAALACSPTSSMLGLIADLEGVAADLRKFLPDVSDLRVVQDDLVLARRWHRDPGRPGRRSPRSSPGYDSIASAPSGSRQLGQLIDEPADAGLLDQVQSSVGLLAVDLVAIVGERPRSS